MNGTTTSAKKPLGVRVTTEQHRIITEAAKREHRSVSSFVLSAALTAAEPNKEKQKLRFSDEEAAEIVKRAQDAFRKSGDSGRDLVEELFAERRAEAMRG